MKKLVTIHAPDGVPEHLRLALEETINESLAPHADEIAEMIAEQAAHLAIYGTPAPLPP